MAPARHRQSKQPALADADRRRTGLIENLVVHHYGTAAVFITPLALLLAEGAQLGTALPQGLIQARFLDTVLGCLVGLAGGACLHSPGFRQPVGNVLRRLLPRSRD